MYVIRIIDVAKKILNVILIAITQFPNINQFFLDFNFIKCTRSPIWTYPATNKGTIDAIRKVAYQSHPYTNLSSVKPYSEKIKIP